MTERVSPEFLRSKNLPVPGWMEHKPSITPDFV
jgi:cysteine synthase